MSKPTALVYIDVIVLARNMPTIAINLESEIKRFPFIPHQTRGGRTGEFLAIDRTNVHDSQFG